MLVTTHAQDDVLTIKILGRFDFKGAQDFEAAYTATHADNHDIVLDLRDTELIDSAALGMLLKLREAVGQNKPVTIKATGIVKQALEIALFDKLFHIHQ